MRYFCVGDMNAPACTLIRMLFVKVIAIKLTSNFLVLWMMLSLLVKSVAYMFAAFSGLSVGV